MKLVEPIREKKKIDALKVYLKGNSLRDHALFVVGINVALRISDLLKLTWADVLNENRKSFRSVKIIEGKTKKKRDTQLNKTSQKALRELLESLDTIVWVTMYLSLEKGEISL